MNCLEERKGQSVDPKLLDQARRRVSEVLEQMEKAVSGKRRVLEQLVTALLAGGHVLIEDVPGVGKTTIASAIARAAGLKFHRVQFTPDVMPSDIVGFFMYNRAASNFEYKQGAVMCNILLADEINRTSPKTQSSLLEVMEEGRVTVEGSTYAVPSPFMVIATQNPMGFVGTHPLPEAQLDRFMMRLTVGYPSMRDELAIMTVRQLANPLDRVEPILSAQELLQLRQLVQSVYIDMKLKGYIVSLVSRTRVHPSVALGASPRASIALMKAAQAEAFLRGRDFCLPEDIANLFPTVIAHRLVLKQEARLKQLDAGTLLNEILSQTQIP